MSAAGREAAPVLPGLTPDLGRRAVRVMVVDDHEVVRAGLASLLTRDDEIEVVGLTGCGEDAIEALDTLEPDVVLLDYRLPGMSGAATCAEIIRRRPETSVVILTTYLDDDIIHACLVAGAHAYVLKDASRSDLVHTVRAVIRGEAVLAPQVTDKVVKWARQAKALHQGGESLTRSEAAILSLVASGLSNRLIAERLNVSTHMVKLHLRSIMRKLGVTKRSEATAVGVRKGLI